MAFYVKKNIFLSFFMYHCNSPLFKFFSKTCASFLDDQRCETRSEGPDPKDFLLLSLINYLVAVNKKQIIESVNLKTKDPGTNTALYSGFVKMTNERISHYEPFIKNKCFQSISNCPNIRKKIKQSWKQISNQDIKQIMLQRVQAWSVRLLSSLLNSTNGKKIAASLQTETLLLVIQSIDQKHFWRQNHDGKPVRNSRIFHSHVL